MKRAISIQPLMAMPRTMVPVSYTHLDVYKRQTQETELFDDNIENNISIAKRDATREAVEAACKKAALDGFIRSLPKGYDTPVGELGGALSGGERLLISEITSILSALKVNPFSSHIFKQYSNIIEFRSFLLAFL